MITNDVISAVRNKANILEVVSQVVMLKRIGKDYKGLCPFHKEKTPSFHVNPEKGIYKCFGCGEGGDIFSFIQKAKGLGFLDAVKELAHQYGVSLIETEAEKTEYKRRGLFLLLYEQACEFYSKLLKDPGHGAMARQYLINRGLDEKTIQEFRLGLAPISWDALTDYLCTTNKVSAITLEEAGLSRKKTEGHGYYDLFRNRLIIPITDEQGRVIAFGGRTLGNDQVKYLNSPETLLYRKGEHLFAFSLAKESIKNDDAVIVVEGYFDAITAHASGLKNTVATLGTALSNEQCKLLVRHTESKRVYLAFDADSAGIKATEKGAQILEQLASGIGLDLRVVSIPGGKDPDECLRSSNGLTLFKQAIENSQSLIDYEINQVTADFNDKSRDGKITIARKIVPILARIDHAIARSEYIRQIANRFDLQESSLISEVNKQRQTRTKETNKQYSNKAPSLKERLRPADGLIDAERWLIAAFISNEQNYNIAFKYLAKEELITNPHRTIIKIIYEWGNIFTNTKDLERKLLDHFASETQISAALVEIILKAEEIEKQKISVPILLLQSRVKLMKERLAGLTKIIRNRLTPSNTETNLLQSKILELNRLERLTLPTVNNMDEIEQMQEKIKEINLSLTNLIGEAS